MTVNQQTLQSLFDATADTPYLWGNDSPLMAAYYKVWTLDVSRFGLDKFFGDAYGSHSGNSMICQITLNFNVGSLLF